mmetsp:Transcript_27798/g.82404  ORF Transcript_27798/g.82404 Transcript_27798/m.82404 type:complete len:133 (+) Transcript_27798:395-793(+)|eukprot:357397-Chlamydomonas_euryale.AAC.5
MPKGRARAYDMLYTGVTTVLACAFAYGLFETGRGTYFILKDARQRAAAAQVRAWPPSSLCLIFSGCSCTCLGPCQGSSLTGHGAHASLSPCNPACTNKMMPKVPWAGSGGNQVPSDVDQMKSISDFITREGY